MSGRYKLVGVTLRVTIYRKTDDNGVEKAAKRTGFENDTRNDRSVIEFCDKVSETN